MLSCSGLTVKVEGSAKPILSDASVSFTPRAMNAVIGPSGCGKTTLLKAMIGILPSSGESFFMGEKIVRSEDLIGKVGFAPQFTCAHPKLTVRESLQSALDIAIKSDTHKTERIEYILRITGLEAHADKLISSLSGGQLRRIGLGLELANNPPAMFCDEITTGLDPLSENNILDFLRGLCDNDGKTFICIIHNLAKLDYFDSITVIYEGEVVFQGTLERLKEHFGVENQLKLYDRLNEYPIEHWRQIKEIAPLPCLKDEPILCEDSKEPSLARPSLLSQTSTLLKRRYKLFFRDRGYLFLTLAITFGFPLVVVIFALNGLPQIEGLSIERSMGFIDELKENLRVQMDAASTSALVTGLILFQVVLLSLMGANNSAREIASERPIYEKERLIGLRPAAYALSKIIFTLSVAGFQGLWMCAFVKVICKFPGGFAEQSMVLCAVCGAMTMISLAFSAMFSSPERANLVAIYLVGFQLPLSGIVLALPEFLKWVCRPFISAYWGWAGYMGSMRESRIYDAYIQTQSSWDAVPDVSLALAVLGLQALAAVYFVFIGCFAKRWQ